MIRKANPGWTEGDVHAKALGLTQFDVPAVLAVLVDNGDWDGGLGALEDPAARGVPVWLIRGEFATGGLIPEAARAGVRGANRRRPRDHDRRRAALAPADPPRGDRPRDPPGARGGLDGSRRPGPVRSLPSIPSRAGGRSRGGRPRRTRAPSRSASRSRRPSPARGATPTPRRRPGSGRRTRGTPRAGRPPSRAGRRTPCPRPGGRARRGPCRAGRPSRGRSGASRSGARSSGPSRTARTATA